MQSTRNGNGKLDKLLIIDCHGICHNVRHAFGGLTWEDRHTGVIYGFLDRILSLSSKLECANIAFAWDSSKSKREKIYPDYKKKRHDNTTKTREEEEIDALAYRQFYELRAKVLPQIGFNNNFIKTGYEADDIIASLVRTYYHAYDITFVSDDQDLYQLLDCANMWKIKKKAFYDEYSLYEDYKGISPRDWVWVKTIGGCSGDEVPGLPGIGEGRAIGYIKGTLTKGKYYQIIKYAPKEFVDRNKKLVELPLEGVGQFDLIPDTITMESITDTCEQYGMYSLIKGRRLTSWQKFI